jgi:sugar phosphate isomerase/epimerase
MRVGVTSRCFRELSVREVVEKFRALGFRYMDLWSGQPDRHADFRAAKAREVAEIRGIFEEHGIRVESYSVGGFRPGEETTIRRAFEFASALGVDVVSGSAHASLVEDIDRWCQETGLRFAIRNQKGSLYQRPSDFSDTLARASSFVGVDLDSAQFAAAGQNPAEAAKALGGRIYHVHLSDIPDPAQLNRTCILGDGAARIPELLLSLMRQGYTGLMTIEHASDPDPSDDLRESLRRAKEWLGV